MSLATIIHPLFRSKNERKKRRHQYLRSTTPKLRLQLKLNSVKSLRISANFVFKFVSFNIRAILLLSHKWFIYLSLYNLANVPLSAYFDAIRNYDIRLAKNHYSQKFSLAEFINQCKVFHAFECLNESFFMKLTLMQKKKNSFINSSSWFV